MNVPQWQMQAAKTAYEAYVKYAGGKSLITGDDLPKFDNLPSAVQNAWHYSTITVLNEWCEKRG